MTRGKKLLIGAGVLVLLGLIVYANFGLNRTTGLSVTTEKITRRDLQAIVTASGTIQPIRSVNVGAESAGRVVDLKVAEGDFVTEGQFLMQIDPRNLQIEVDSQEQSLAAAQSQLEETRRSVQSSKAALAQAQVTFDRESNLLKRGLAARADFDNAQNNLAMAQAAFDQGSQSLTTQETRIKMQEAAVQNAQYDLSKVRITSPITGVVTKRSVEQGEMQAGSQFSASSLITIADMSVIRCEIEVDETDIPSVAVNQPGSTTIDAMPDQTFPGKVTELGNSPIQATGASATTRATDFKVVVTLDKPIKSVRPGFTCSSTITTATRTNVLSVPIQAETVREMVVDAQGHIVPPDEPAKNTHRPAPVNAAPPELKPGQSRKEIEGVFAVRNGKATFVPVKTGIAGDKYFEVLQGLQAGDEVITGPFASVRNLKDGDAVKPQAATSTPASAPAK